MRKNNSMKKRKGNFLIITGLLLLAAALVLTGYNIYESKRAQITSDEAVDAIVEKLEEDQDDSVEDIPLYEKFPDKEMPTILVNGQRYVGILEVPEKGLTLAVLAGEWSYPKLRIAPCLYSGSIYRDDTVIAGHNYSSHFSKIKTLKQDSEVKFTDVEGNEFYYKVGWTDVLEPEQVDVLTEATDWDLTLFTCTYGGRERCAVRCIREK